MVTLTCGVLGLARYACPGGSGCPVEPKRLRLRLFSVAGRAVRGGRRIRLHISAAGP
jgi:hypothetical protein